jgi:hypothetical protein
MSADLLQLQLQEVTQTRQWFYGSLSQEVPMVAINFDPALEIWTHRTFFKSRVEEFKEYEKKQIKTALRERLGLATSVFVYSIDKNGDIINNLIPEEKFKVFLERGILYRASIGSKEQEREQAELEGFLKITEKLTDKKTPNGTMMVSISGTGIVEGTFYANNYIDIYQKTVDKHGNIVISMTRFRSSNDYEEYIRKAMSFNPHYFDKFKGPIDAWFLKNPIPVKPQEKFTSPEGLFSKIFNNNKESMEEKKFQELFAYCMPLILNYIDLLCSDILDPRLIALNQNAILNKADEFLELKNRPKQEIYIYQSLHEEMFKLGIQTVRAVAGDCGISGGVNMFDNSVARFGLKDSKGDRQFKCPACNYTNTRPHEGYVTSCQNPGYCPNRSAVVC